MENNNNPEEYNCKTGTHPTKELKLININSHPHFYLLIPASQSHLQFMTISSLGHKARPYWAKQVTCCDSHRQAKQDLSLSNKKKKNYIIYCLKHTFHTEPETGSAKADPIKVFIHLPYPKHIPTTKKLPFLLLLLLLKGQPQQEGHLLTHPSLQALHSSSAKKGAGEGAI